MSKTLSKIKCPGNKKEERMLKNGLEEDDNEDIAYLNFNIVWPVIILSTLSLICFGIGIYSMEAIDHMTLQRNGAGELLLRYGKEITWCPEFYPKGENFWPSIFRQIEIKYITNIFYRISVCVPMAVRIFLAMILRNYLENNPEHVKKSLFHRLLNDFSVFVIIMEVFSQAMFSIVTIRFDSPMVYHYSFTVFAVCSCIYMFLRILLMFASITAESEKLDTFSIFIKTMAAAAYFWKLPQFYWTHVNFIQRTPCHGYVPKEDALTEYLVIASYLLFHLTVIIDIRDIRFICYPRTSSGECEPLIPENFQKTGKYEYCRSYELRQRQIANLKI